MRGHNLKLSAAALASSSSNPMAQVPVALPICAPISKAPPNGSDRRSPERARSGRHFSSHGGLLQNSAPSSKLSKKLPDQLTKRHILRRNAQFWALLPKPRACQADFRRFCKSVTALEKNPPIFYLPFSQRLASLPARKTHLPTSRPPPASVIFKPGKRSPRAPS